MSEPLKSWCRADKNVIWRCIPFYNFGKLTRCMMLLKQYYNASVSWIMPIVKRALGQQHKAWYRCCFTVSWLVGGDDEEVSARSGYRISYVDGPFNFTDFVQVSQSVRSFVRLFWLVLDQDVVAKAREWQSYYRRLYPS